MRLGKLFAFLLGFAAMAAQGDVLELQACTDAAGQPVPVVSDSSLDVIVSTNGDGKRRVIRYNPALLPELSGEARQFFFAHECARQSLGIGSDKSLTPRMAFAVDCIGLATLKESGLLRDAAAVDALQAELEFSDEQWPRLPGPRRSFHFAACPKQAGMVLPRTTPPTSAQVGWEACVRQCGDRLFRCRGDACQETYDRCESVCKLH